MHGNAILASTYRAGLSRGSKEVFLMSIHTQTNGQSCLSPEKRPPKASGPFIEANSVVKSCNGDYANAPVTLTRKLLPLLRLSSIWIMCQSTWPLSARFSFFFVHLSTVSTEYIVKRRVVRNCLNFSWSNTLETKTNRHLFIFCHFDRIC